MKRLSIPRESASDYTSAGFPIRTMNDQMLTWMSGLKVLDTKRYILPGGWETRSFDPDSRLNLPIMVQGGVNVGPKMSDKVAYYEHVATVHHSREGLTFIVFQMTMDALLASQKDPDKFPAHLMKSAVKKTELRHFVYLVRNPPTQTTSSLSQWLTSLDDFGDALGCDVTWIYDVISYFLINEGVIEQTFVTR